MRIYTKKTDPKTYPEFTVREHRVPTWELFDQQTQFIVMRCFNLENNRMVSIGEDLDLYTERFDLGRVVWPFFSTLYAENLDELAVEMKRRNLFFFDVWGHVPGSEINLRSGSNVTPPAGTLELLNNILGEHFLGIDNGEQDGRYIGRYALQQCPSNNKRFAQFMNFHRFFRKMGDELGNKMNVLLSLCHAHYFAREGNNMLLGAEAAQGLPCSQIYYSFIRGAGKQHGVLWFGNVSVFNRWGYKGYCQEQHDHYPRVGIDEGTSLALMRRLLYSHILYNSVAVGFEQGWFLDDDNELRIGKGHQFHPEKPELSPIGIIQETASKWVKVNGDPGVMITPAAILLDAFGGWNPPIHLYIDDRGQSYQCWSTIPYNEGDYLTHGVFSLLYPGYEAASYYRNEKGFMAPTPFGDSADVLLSDARTVIIDQYNLVIAAGKIDPSTELRDKLETFMTHGGTLVITAGNATALWSQYAGTVTEVPAGSIVKIGNQTITEPHDFKLMNCPVSGEIIAATEIAPLAVKTTFGKGSMILLMSEWGINAEALPAQLPKNMPDDLIDHPLPTPFVMLEHVKEIIAAELRKEQIFSVSNPELAFTVNRRTPGEYTVGIFNNGLQNQSFDLVSDKVEILEQTELAIDQRVKLARGYWPTNHDLPLLAECKEDVISGGDVRIFRLKVREKTLHEYQTDALPEYPVNRLLALRGNTPAMEAVLSMPTFMHHFSGVKLDWRYLYEHDCEFLRSEGKWFKRQKLEVWVDFSSGCNHYPTLHLLDTYQPHYRETQTVIANVMDKMVLFGAINLILSLHIRPECQCPEELAVEKFLEGIKTFCAEAAKRGMEVHLQSHPRKFHNTPDAMTGFIAECNCPNLHLAVNTGHRTTTTAVTIPDDCETVLACALDTDIMGNYYDYHLPFRRDPTLSAALENYRGKLIFDAVYNGWDDIYADLKMLN